ncbi:hypothetical protein PS704_01339 [Pseudomonas fluorescens]|uniref:Uncharacterized protein n=2 Tax=Pseudomonas fluorescens TaxID=294 RepID=A0A5E7BEQ4_PSEFL|nr:hypothetical protein PS704_01339 [Pseudomonas fluorescens]
MNPSKFETPHAVRDHFEKITPMFRAPPQSDTNSTDDSPSSARDTLFMNDITREELSLTLSAIESRMDKRIDRMESTEEKRSESYRREQEARDKLYTERFEAMHKRLEDRDAIIDSKLDTMSSSVKLMTQTVDGFEVRLDKKLDEVKSSNRSARWATLAIAAATVVGIWGVNSTIVGSVTGFFDAGQSTLQRQQVTEKLIIDAKAQSDATYKLLLEMQAREQAKPPQTENKPQ